jgi:neutral ceramidase
LYAGALVLQDPSGERIALVVADLTHLPANLHRLVAARIEPLTGIGADRLVVSATHTHSGPSHFYGARRFNLNVARVPGYDRRMVDLLVERIARSVIEAAGRLQPVRLALGRTALAGVTRNRSLEAHCLDPEARRTAACDPDRPRAELAVDPTLFMLRVDRVVGQGTAPLGSYSIFALHGTAVPSVNTLLDGDAHVRIVERLARHTDSLAGARDAGSAVHILANGAEGDVAPELRGHGCEIPRIELADAVPAPRGPGELVDFVEPRPERTRRCLDDALEELDTLGARVAGPAIRLYDELGRRLRTDIRIRRTFATLPLPGNDGLCAEPTVGSSTAAGAEGLETRVRGWHWIFPFVKIGLDEGPPAVQPDRRCSSPKRRLLAPLHTRLVVGEHGFPDVAQLTLVQIDTVLLGAVPVEATTVAGRRMRDAMLRARGGAPPAKEAYLIGLADGFLLYVTTAEEYQWQSYEGGFTLYGPGSEAFFQRRLAELAAALPDGDAPSPAAIVGPITAYPGPSWAILPSPTAGPPVVPARMEDAGCEGGHVAFTWLDLAPGRLFPRDGPLLTLEQKVSTGWGRVATDGDGNLEVEEVGSRGDRGYLWTARWRLPAAGQVRISRVEGDGASRTLALVTCHDSTSALDTPRARAIPSYHPAHHRTIHNATPRVSP